MVETSAGENIKIYEHSWQQRPDILFTVPEHLLLTSMNERTDAVRKQKPRPKKNPTAKVRWKSSRLSRFFGIQTAPSSLIIFQRAKLSTWSITHLCWCNWRTLWRENAAGSSPRGSCFCTTMPRLTGHLQPRRNWPTWASNALITHPPYSSDLVPSDYHLFSGLKTQLKGRHFSSDAEVIAAAETWLEGQPYDFFFDWLAKVRATG